MLVLARSVGESIVFDNTHCLTITHIDSAVVRVTLCELAIPKQVTSCTLRMDESVKVLPNVDVTLVALSVKPRRARLGIVAPPEISYHRKEVFNPPDEKK
ncbi:hypothetical protein AYO44_09870 [Planctomycetaceae bacterium SCGC AG-212-F19]|nr:hypothetical protein AYO44_09870 [Planctomycetaceae bacterium SCGC AG-212-F19]